MSHAFPANVCVCIYLSTQWQEASGKEGLPHPRAIIISVKSGMMSNRTGSLIKDRGKRACGAKVMQESRAEKGISSRTHVSDKSSSERKVTRKPVEAANPESSVTRHLLSLCECV